MWKISILDMRNASKFEAVLTEKDLTEYFECQVFEFFRQHPDMPMPDILELLRDYLMNL